MKALLDLNLTELKQVLKKNQFPEYAANQIFHWVYKKGKDKFQNMDNLSNPLRTFLKEDFYMFALSLVEVQVSSEGTRKYLFSLPKNEDVIESVLIPEGKRLTACLSVQVGCKFACRFCASAVKGFRRNLIRIDSAQRDFCFIVTSGFFRIKCPVRNFFSIGL